jgi:DNA-binding MarR family transcriptional regulator
LFFAAGCSTVVAADKGKPIERWGRKASGLRTHVYDSGVAAMNADMQSALIDAALWLYRAFFFPGDQFLSRFPELDVAGHGRVVGGLISAVVWIGAIVSIIALCRLVGNVDRALTAMVRRLYEEAQRAGRVVARRLSIALKSYALERQARLSRTEVHEQPALSGLQLYILRTVAGLPPAHFLTPGDIARRLAMSSADVEVVLGTLRKMSLVDRSLGADDGEDGYRLTKAGEVFLAASHRAQQARQTASPQRTERPKRVEPRLGSA